MILLSFLAAILAGTILLVLPFSTTEPGAMNVIDAFFTSTSAVCVTGLIVVDTGTFFTPFGQLVILILIQVGGLGIMTMSTFFLIMLKRRMSLKDRLILQDTVGQSRIQGLKSLLKMIVITTFLVEAAGAFLIAWRLRQAHGYRLAGAIVSGIFHSVSAFCNAGFSLYRTVL